MSGVLHSTRSFFSRTGTLIVLSFAAFCSGGHAQSTHFAYVHKIWRAEEGLLSPAVRAIIQNKDGYLWLGTDEGLARFDGVQFRGIDKKITTDKVDRWIVPLTETRDGSIWTASANGGLLCFKDGKQTRYTTTNGLPNDYVLSAMEDSHSNLWIGTAGGIARFTNGKFVTYTNQPGLIVEATRALAEDSLGRIWIGTAAGVSCLDQGKFTSYTTNNLLVNNAVMSLCAARDGVLWIGTGAGLTRVVKGRPQHFTINEGLVHSVVRAIYEDKRGQIWIGTQGGLQRFVDGRILNVPFRSLTEDFEGVMFCYSICEDREGNLWIGTNLGLNRLQPPKFKSITTDEGLPHNLATVVYEDDSESLWIGTYGGGLCSVEDQHVTTWNTRNGLSSDYVLGLAHDSYGTMWVGTEGAGLNRIAEGVFTQFLDGEPASPANTVRVVYPDSRGNLWLGHNGGVSRFLNDQLVLQTNIPRSITKVIIEDKQSNLWFGGRWGLTCRFFPGDKIKVYKEADGLSIDRVNALYEDNDGVLWIGTEAGLNRMQTVGKFTAFRTPEGPFTEHILHIVEDDYGRLWMSTHNGVFVAMKKELNDFARGTRSAVNFISFGKRDGMRRAQCNGIAQPAGWKANDGRIWFPTMHGVVVFDPKEIVVNSTPPPVIIEELIVDGVSQTAGPNVELPPGRGQLEFHYTGLSFQAPEKVRFRYQLESVDKDWVDGGTRRFARYANLAPGTYQFHVSACNNDGVWSPKPAAITFTLAPHFYQTSVFYALWIFAAVLGGFGIHRLRIRVHESRERELAKLVEQRTAKLQELVKSMESFNYSIAHDLRAPIRAIRGFTQALIEDYRPSFDEMGCEYAHRIQLSVDRMDQLIQDLLIYGQLTHKEIPLEKISSENVLNRVLDTFSPELQTKKATVEVSRPLPAVWGNETILQQIFANLISNGMKFMPPETPPQLKIWSEEKNGHVKFYIRDNGIGIKPQHYERIFRIFERLHSSEIYPGTGIGLAIVQRGAERMGGRVGVESTSGEGSCFWVELPKENKTK